MRVTFWCLGACFVMACGGGDSQFATSGTTTSGAGAGGMSAGTGGLGGAGAQGGATTGGSGATGGGGVGGGGGAPIVCPMGALGVGEHQRSIMFDGLEREYEVQIPAGYDNTTPVPLVFDIHGFTNSKDTQQAISGWEAVAEQNGLVMVRPDGVGVAKSWNAGDVCCGTAHDQNLDDVGLMKAIAAEVQQLACIDPQRIYASGFSNGAALTHRLGCEAWDVFAAIAPVSYPIDFDPFDKCAPGRDIAVMHSHGYGDLVVPYNGGLSAAPTPDSFAYWAATNGCTGDPVVTLDQGGSTCETYESCGSGVKTVLCSVTAGHVAYNNADQVPIAELSWTFLSQFTLP